MSIDADFWTELADVRTLLDEATRRYQRAETLLEGAAALALARGKALEQIRAFVEDALLCSDDDVGAMRDYLYFARDVGRP